MLRRLFEESTSHGESDRSGVGRGRFDANDNIAAYIQEGELDQLRLEVAGKIDEVLRALVIASR